MFNFFSRSALLLCLLALLVSACTLVSMTQAAVAVAVEAGEESATENREDREETDAQVEAVEGEADDNVEEEPEASEVHTENKVKDKKKDKKDKKDVKDANHKKDKKDTKDKKDKKKDTQDQKDTKDKKDKKKDTQDQKDTKDKKTNDKEPGKDAESKGKKSKPKFKKYGKDVVTAYGLLKKSPLLLQKFGKRDWSAATEEDIVFTPVVVLEVALENGELSAEQVVTAFWNRAHAVNKHVNAVTEWNENAIEEARALDAQYAANGTVGRLHGIPVSIKDHIAAKGMLLTMGAPVWREYRSPADSPVVERLRAEGAIILCKTNMPELGLSFDTGNHLFGQTHNPYSLERSAGGSSGGEGALIAAGGSPLGIGSDVGGSLRVPASWNGIVSLKPSQGRVPLTGSAPGFEFWEAWHSVVDMLTIGPMARYVEDLILAIDIIAGSDGVDPQASLSPFSPLQGRKPVSDLRVGYFYDDGHTMTTPSTHAAIDTALEALRAAGVVNIVESVPSFFHESTFLLVRSLGRDGGVGIKHLFQLGGQEPSAQAAFLVPYYEEYGMKDVAEADSLIMEINQFRSKMLSWMHSFDVVLCPTTFSPALLPENIVDRAYVPGKFGYTIAYNLARFPSSVLGAVGVATEEDHAGMPVSVQVVSAPNQEALALQVAALIQERVPNVSEMHPVLSPSTESESVVVGAEGVVQEDVAESDAELEVQAEIL